jgi:ATP-binding cassette subfamily C (CFTR/MRP) protein 1
LNNLSRAYTEILPPESKTSPANLNKVIFLLLKWPMLIPVIPRLVLLALTFCQPLLLKRLLQYLEYSDTDDMNIGYGLIGAYLIVYLGIAVSTAIGS